MNKHMNKIRIYLLAICVLAAGWLRAEEKVYSECMPEGRVCIESQSLEKTENQAHLKIVFRLDSTYLKHMTWVSLTPAIQLDTTREKRLHTMLVAGKRQQIVFDREGVDTVKYGTNYERIDRRVKKLDKQQVKWQETFDYEAWMDSAEVVVLMEDCGCGKVRDTSDLAVRPVSSPDPRGLALLIEAEHKEEALDTLKMYELHGTAYINFVVDKWNIHPDYMRNATELRKITDTLDIMVADKNISVRSIRIHGWASPESPYEHNAMLSLNRAQSLTGYVKSLYKLPSSVFLPAEATPENWIGVVEYLHEHGAEIAHSAEILKMIGDPDKVTGQKADDLEAQIRNKYSESYNKLLTECYPFLRRSDYEVIFDVRFFTLEEAREIIKEHPYQLSLREMMMVANSYGLYTPEYNAVVRIAYEYYGKDHSEACVNMANVLIQEGDLKTAQAVLLHADDSAAAENARGVLALYNKDWAHARKHFERAQEQGADVKANLHLTDALETHPGNK